MPEILGQPIYYTQWTKSIAYLVIDGECIKGYYYNEVMADKKIIDCKINELLMHDEIWGFSYQNILSVKEIKISQISIAEQEHLFDDDINEILEKSLNDNQVNQDDSKSVLEKKIEELEIKKYLQTFEDIAVSEKLKKEERRKKNEVIFSLIPFKYKYKYDSEFGTHISMPTLPGIITIMYKVMVVPDYSTLSKYYECELIKSTSNNKSTKFYFDKPCDNLDEDENQIIILQFDTNSHKVIINMGILLDKSLCITKRPMITRFQELYVTEEQSLNSTYYDLISLSENCVNNLQEKWFITDIRKSSAIIIDPDTAETLKREVFYDEREKCLKAKIKLTLNKPYFTFLINGEDTNQPCEPLTLLEIGHYYRSGENGFPKDLYKSVQFLEKYGSPKALYEIACMFRDEIDVQNNDIYFEYLYKSATLNYSQAVIELTLSVFNNETKITDFQECILLLCQVANSGYALGNFMVAYFQEMNIIESKSTEDIFELYYKSALERYEPALVRLRCQSLEELKECNQKELYNWFVKSIQKQNNIAYYCMGCIYFFGILIKVQRRKGINLLLEAANLGNVDAQYTLFKIYDIDKDYFDKSEALKWLKIVAQSRISVYNELAGRLLDGIGCEINEKNDRQAFFLYKQATLTNNAVSINNLAWMYKNGRGCVINYECARKLFKKAADLGSAKAYCHLGEIYEKGLGVTANTTKAKEYYSMAVDMGYEKAQQYLSN